MGVNCSLIGWQENTTTQKKLHPARGFLRCSTEEDTFSFLHFLFLYYWFRGRKTSGSVAPHGDNEIKTTLSLVFFFSFSDWHLLIWGSWLPFTCFQSHFKLAAGDPTQGMFFKKAGWGTRRERRLVVVMEEGEKTQIKTYTGSLWKYLLAFSPGLTKCLNP